MDIATYIIGGLVTFAVSMLMYLVGKVYYLNHKITAVEGEVRDIRDIIKVMKEEIGYLRQRLDNLYDKFFKK